MSLKKFIQQQNKFAAFFPTEPVYPEKTADLTAEQKKQLADCLLSCLSPESLTCDGELRGAKLISKARMLNQAKADLEAMGQKVEYDYSY
jgi:hypothetical protein